MKVVLTFTITVLAAVALSAPAQAAPCWEVVIEDWFDNSRVDQRYPIHCYREALRNLPEDMRAYSSAPEDIARAMRQEIARQNQGGSTGNGSDGGQTGGLGGTGGSGGNQKPTAPIGTTEPAVEAAPPPESSNDGIFPQAIEEIGPESASSFPLPLAVLLGVALLLMAAGGMGLIARRMRPPRPPLQRR